MLENYWSKDMDRYEDDFEAAMMNDGAWAFVRTYLSFLDFLKIVIYLRWPLEGLLLELCNETIHITVLTLG